MHPIFGYMLPNRESDEEKRFRQVLREARTKAGLRQSDLAGQLGVPQSFVSKFETGERLLTFVETLVILDRLDVSVQNMVKRLRRNCA